MADKLKKKKKKKAQKPERYVVLRRDLETLPVAKVYPQLVAKLQINVKEVGDLMLSALILECSEDRRLSGYIYAIAKEDADRVKDEYTKWMGVWTERAREAISDLKKRGLWHGAVYPTDLEQWIAANVKKWATAKKNLRKAERMKRAAQTLYEAYEGRLSSLQTYARLRGRHLEKSIAQRNAEREEQPV